jgi:hypothetical protein
MKYYLPTSRNFRYPEFWNIRLSLNFPLLWFIKMFITVALTTTVRSLFCIKIKDGFHLVCYSWHFGPTWISYLDLNLEFAGLGGRFLILKVSLECGGQTDSSWSHQGVDEEPPTKWCNNCLSNTTSCLAVLQIL